MAPGILTSHTDNTTGERAKDSFVIREAGRRDLDSIAALWREMMNFHVSLDPRFRLAKNADRDMNRHLFETLRSREARIAVADAGDQLIGFATAELHAMRPLYPAGKYGLISDVCVTEAWRRIGVGRALAQDLLEWFRSKRVTTVELYVGALNPVSIAFWEALGFRDFLRLKRLELPEV